MLGTVSLPAQTRAPPTNGSTPPSDETRRTQEWEQEGRRGEDGCSTHDPPFLVEAIFLSWVDDDEADEGSWAAWADVFLIVTESRRAASRSSSVVAVRDDIADGTERGPRTRRCVFRGQRGPRERERGVWAEGRGGLSAGR